MRHRTPIKWVDFSLPKDSKRTLDLSEQQSKHSATPRHQQLFSNQNVGGHMPAATRDEKGWKEREPKDLGSTYKQL